MLSDAMRQILRHVGQSTVDIFAVSQIDTIAQWIVPSLVHREHGFLATLATSALLLGVRLKGLGSGLLQNLSEV